jgi:hypothetical protein
MSRIQKTFAELKKRGIYANLNFPQDYPDHPANRRVAKFEARISKSETISNAGKSKIRDEP